MEILMKGMTVRHGMTEALWTSGLRLIEGKQHMFGPSDSAGLGNHFFTQHIYVHSVRLVEGHFYRYMCIIYIIYTYSEIVQRSTYRTSPIFVVKPLLPCSLP